MAAEPRIIGRYALHGEIASGGMATVHLGRLLGQAGFSRTVAIKRLHPPFAKDPEFVAMFLEEARLAARIQHPNVVSTLDVETNGEELLLVLEFVLGESLARLIRASYQSSTTLPLSVILGILVGALEGLHAAHEARSEQGEPLGIVHRDISPQNILVGADGVARVLDFGIAKATRRSEQTRSGLLKGKVAYMPPEQIKGGTIDRRTDIYAMGVVLWETLTGYRLFDGEDDFQIANKILTESIPPPSHYRTDIPPALDAVALQALARDVRDRFPTALAMINALETTGALASSREISRWVDRVAGSSLRNRSELITEVERGSEPAVSARPSLLHAPPAATPPRPSLHQPRPSLHQPRPSLIQPLPSIPARPSLVGSRPSFLRAPNEPPAPPQPPAPPPETAAPVPPPALRIPQLARPPVPPPPSLLRPLSPSQPDLLTTPEEPETLPPPAVPPPPPMEAPAASADAIPAVAPPAPPEPTQADAPLAVALAAAPPPIPSPPAPSDTPSPLAAEGTIAQTPLGALLVPPSSPESPEPGGSSQISGVSVLHTLPTPPTSRPAVRWGLGGAAVLLLGVGLLWARSSSHQAKESDPGKVSEVPSVSATIREEPPPTAEPSASVAPVDSAPPVASAPEVITAGPVDTAPPVETAAHPPRPKTPVAPKKGNCNPPYTIDKKGIKRIKPECT